MRTFINLLSSIIPREKERERERKKGKEEEEIPV